MLSVRDWRVGWFCLLQGGIYLSFLSMDLWRRGPSTTPLKYLGILLCLAYSLYWSVRGGDRLISGALALTLGADTFLLVLNTRYVLGVLLFCCVQLLYFLRIYRWNGGQSWWGLRLVLFLAALAILRLAGLMSPLNVLAMLYFSNFLCSALQSLGLNGPRCRLFSAGLLLFLCCDVCVGLFQYAWLLPAAAGFARVGMWMFYLPAQVLITLSGLPNYLTRGVPIENQ